MTINFVVVVKVLESMCHIDKVILYLHIFVYDIVVAMIDDWV